MASINPNPNTGVGMRKMILEAFEKSTGARTHPDGASEFVDSSVRRAIRFPDKADLPDRSIGRYEGRERIVLIGKLNLGVDSRAAAAHSGLDMAGAARIGIEPRTELDRR